MTYEQKIHDAPDELIRMRKNGMTLQAIANLYGVTRERVRQIIRKRLSREEARDLANDRWDQQSKQTELKWRAIRAEKLKGNCRVCGMSLLKSRLNDVAVFTKQGATIKPAYFLTCSPKCHAEWARGYRYNDPEIYRRHRIMHARWMLEHNVAPETAKRIIEHDGRPFGRNTTKHRDQIVSQVTAEPEPKS